VEVELLPGSPRLDLAVEETLSLFDAPWDGTLTRVRLAVAETRSPGPEVEGSYLDCARMRVDRAEGGLRASCLSGVGARYREGEGRWEVAFPAEPRDRHAASDVGDVVQLALTTGWRQLGWVPMHSGGVRRGNRCLLLCCPSGGGKTTLAVALIRRGFRILGDDKLLLRIGEGGVVEIRALSCGMNLHPEVRRWFPEVGDLGRLPPYSEWTEKRRVSVEWFWPGRLARRGQPTDLVRIVRTDEKCDPVLADLEPGEVLSVLLRQTVIPSDRETAKRILEVLAAAAPRIRGFELRVGRNAYANGGGLDEILEAWR
jgi:hypothetical protein